MADQDELEAWLTVLRAPGLGPVGVQRLMQNHEHPSEILTLSAARLQQAGVKESARAFLAKPDRAQVQQDSDWMRDNRCLLISQSDPRYPALLKTIADPPPVLFVLGDVELLDRPQLAIVGSRTATVGGRETAFEFARHLAGRGLGITSGMAVGIDGEAHRGALSAQGITVAVTGTGPDRIYPSQHRELAHTIGREGVIVTEYPPGTRPAKATFPRRNRIISGLSLGTLVVEAAKGSGSLITARLAAEQGREVFAIPGSIHNPMVRGCHQLIRQGAKLVETAEDILEELGPLLAGPARPTAGDPGVADAKAPEEPEQRALLELMGWDPVSIDKLVERGGLTPAAVSSMLLQLELGGYVAVAKSGLYARLRS